MPKYTVIYFPLYARAEPARMMLAHAGADWADKHVTGPTWQQMKVKVPGNQVPALQLEDETMMGQSVAIATYLGKELGYYPTDVMKAYECDALIQIFGDRFTPLVEFGFKTFDNDADREKALSTVFDEEFPKLMKNLAPWVKKD